MTTIDPAEQESPNGGAATGADAGGSYLGDLGKASPAGSGNADPGPGQVLSALAILSAEQGETRAHLAELRDHLGDVLEQVGNLDKLVSDVPILSGRLASLTDAVDQLLRQPEDSKTRPVDLAHVPPEERREVLGELVVWVRDVLFTGWPWTQDALRPCWLHHPDLVNGMLWLRAAYNAAYDMPKAQPHAAGDFHRWLDDVMDRAAGRTEQCPEPGAPDPHPVPAAPRDDTATLDAVMRRPGLDEICEELYRLMQIRPDTGYAPGDVEAATQRTRQIIAETGVTEEQFNEYVRSRRATPQAGDASDRR
ncbi:hypothetical protein [Actinomadura montaniterrae]|uniref:Uncharacterized protein n=1 Tax=Actinomadura montaniterrae TaxID=1803903 RepID=A0A6L3VYA1_9ACTN|nr:hypothetical protein [Actinomadura montaniterrae]KAB2376967.1 hypothetical protein F9B16_24335 [Actinomadura montaniterrae]